MASVTSQPLFNRAANVARPMPISLAHVARVCVLPWKSISLFPPWMTGRVRASLMSKPFLSLYANVAWFIPTSSAHVWRGLVVPSKVNSLVFLVLRACSVYVVQRQFSGQ